jgi:hypothetical protein
MIQEIKRVGRKSNKAKGLGIKENTTTVVLPEHKKALLKTYGTMANAIESLAVYTIHNDNLPLITK